MHVKLYFAWLWASVIGPLATDISPLPDHVPSTQTCGLSSDPQTSGFTFFSVCCFAFPSACKNLPPELPPSIQGCLTVMSLTSGWTIHIPFLPSLELAILSFSISSSFICFLVYFLAPEATYRAQVGQILLSLANPCVPLAQGEAMSTHTC